MNQPLGRIGAAAALLLALAAVALAGARPAAADGPTPPILTVSVGGSANGATIQPSFLGFSFEFQALHVYTGRDPFAVNPVLLQLIRNLNPGQTPVLRIGGRSTDATWWRVPKLFPGGGVSYRLTPGWLRTTHTLASKLGARLILGVNLQAGRPAIATAEARAFLEGIGRGHIEALEIGNEPDLYGTLPWYHTLVSGHPVFARPPSYSVAGFTREFSRWRAALPPLPIAGPTFANLPWLSALGSFLSAEPGLGLVTFHRYPLRGCSVTPGQPTYPTLESLLSDYSSDDLALGIAQAVSLTHSVGRRFRLDELNSVACSGRRGVSNTFASALWMVDTLFAMAAVGVDGVNVHTLPGAEYEPFTFSHIHGRWRAFVRPEYYGLLLFSRAAPPGARLLPVTGASGQVKVWATLAPDGTRRVVLINKDLGAAHQVNLKPGGPANPAVLEQLQASSAAATRGVTLAGQSYGSATATGTLAGTPQDEPTTPVGGVYSVTLPAASAVMLTL